jgi:O-antigen ligase
MLVFQMTYNTSKNAQPLILVHNGYLSLFYDFGLPGLLLFVGVLAAAGWAWGRLWQPAWAAYRPLLVTMVAMAGYFLIASGFDEMIYMFDAPLLFWVLTTVIASLLCRLAAAAGDGHSGH